MCRKAVEKTIWEKALNKIDVAFTPEGLKYLTDYRAKKGEIKITSDATAANIKICAFIMGAILEAVQSEYLVSLVLSSTEYAPREFVNICDFCEQILYELDKNTYGNNLGEAGIGISANDNYPPVVIVNKRAGELHPVLLTDNLNELFVEEDGKLTLRKKNSTALWRATLDPLNPAYSFEYLGELAAKTGSKGKRGQFPFEYSRYLCKLVTLTLDLCTRKDEDDVSIEFFVKGDFKSHFMALSEFRKEQMFKCLGIGSRNKDIKFYRAFDFFDRDCERFKITAKINEKVFTLFFKKAKDNNIYINRSNILKLVKDCTSPEDFEYYADSKADAQKVGADKVSDHSVTINANTEEVEEIEMLEVSAMKTDNTEIEFKATPKKKKGKTAQKDADNVTVSKERSREKALLEGLINATSDMLLPADYYRLLKGVGFAEDEMLEYGITVPKIINLMKDAFTGYPEKLMNAMFFTKDGELSPFTLNVVTKVTNNNNYTAEYIRELVADAITGGLNAG